jgi:hypothetical protein
MVRAELHAIHTRFQYHSGLKGLHFAFRLITGYLLPRLRRIDGPRAPKRTNGLNAAYVISGPCLCRLDLLRTFAEAA